MRKRDYFGEEQELFRLVFHVTQLWQTIGDRELAAHRLTTKQWLLLGAVADSGGSPPTLSEAARKYGSSRQNVKQIASQLEKRGCLTLDRDPSDRRSVRLTLTEEGRGIIAARDMVEVLFDGLLWRIGDDQLQLVNDTLKKLVETANLLDSGEE